MSAGSLSTPPAVAITTARSASSWSLIGVAVAMEAVYAGLLLWPMRIWSRPVSPNTNLVQTFGIDRVGAARYVLIVAVLFALYGAALWLVLCAGSIGRRWIIALGGAAAFGATLALTHPLSSADVFSYISSARIQWVYGDNPLTTPPLAHPEDPFFQLIFFWRDVPSPYGPLWSLVAGVPHALGRDQPAMTVVAFKATSAAFLLGAGALAGLTAERLRPGSGPAAAIILTWNPLAVWHVAGNGHNDAVMACLLALAAYLLVRGPAGPALLALTASALVKFATLLLLPAVAVWWWRRAGPGRIRRTVPWLVAAAALTAAAYAPFWQGLDTFRTSLDEGSYFAVSGPAALRGALVRLAGMGNEAADRLAVWAGRLVFLGVYAGLLWRLRLPAPPASTNEQGSSLSAAGRPRPDPGAGRDEAGPPISTMAYGLQSGVRDEPGRGSDLPAKDRGGEEAGPGRGDGAGAPAGPAAVEQLLVAGAQALIAYLALAATYFAPWYVLWPLTLAAMLPRRRQALAPALAMSAGAMTVLLWATWARARWSADPLADWYPMHLLSFVCVALPAAAAWWWARGTTGRSADVDPPVVQSEVAGAGLEG